ncbi:MAG: hypothetical protein QF790_08060 [Gammaproteobacteria bacterium]|jgi:hypothetical protein|nr:hypothetical protein [Gammaproteobacteria bacterium]MDP6617100.1 hypothetical protein [Gammaproteobacteria bacterium]MDP6695790.1 hypothetical protein [Gammaproteobacteria bacterium]
MQPDPAWEGAIAFHELMFGTWLSYILLVILWEKVLRAPLQEWKYLLLTCLSASFFVINHYFFFAPFYLWVINGYTLIFACVWYGLGMRQEGRTLIWKCAGLMLVIVHSASYIGFELLARLAVEQGVHEVWIMVASYAGFAGIILWRRA